MTFNSSIAELTHRIKRMLPLAILSCGWLMSGCTTASKYRSTDTPTAPIAFRIATSEPPLEVMIHTVIIYEGPGSWKEKALWDEYLVSIENTSASPLELTQASLTDVLGQEILSGDDPWALEAASTRNRDHYTETGVNIAIGTLGAATVAAGAGVYYLMGSAAIGTAAVAAIPIYFVGVQVVNSQNRGKVEAEFARRRLVLPLALQPGQRISGSLIFPQTPGPRALTFHGLSGSQDVRVSVDLAATPLTGLHIGEPKRE